MWFAYWSYVIRGSVFIVLLIWTIGARFHRSEFSIMAWLMPSLVKTRAGLFVAPSLSLDKLFFSLMHVFYGIHELIPSENGWDKEGFLCRSTWRRARGNGGRCCIFSLRRLITSHRFFYPQIKRQSSVDNDEFRKVFDRPFAAPRPSESAPQSSEVQTSHYDYNFDEKDYKSEFWVTFYLDETEFIQLLVTPDLIANYLVW